jgi:quinol monooxygenase YgiN
MILVTARMTCHPGREEEFVAAAKDVIASTTATEPGCLAYACSRDVVDGSQFVFVEQWQDSMAIKEHVASEHYQRFALAAKETVAAQEVHLHTVEKTRTL